MVRYDPDHESDDVLDQRRRRGPGGGGSLLQFIVVLLELVARRFGVVGVLVALLLLVGAYTLVGSVTVESAPPAQTTAPADEGAAFTGFVLDDIQATWTRRLDGYERAQLVLFRDSVPTACGFGSSASGPFYCPGDRRVYLDLGFFDALARLGGTGDFAAAYVIAHEVGHHIQNQANILGRTRGPDAVGATGNAVRVELQADCLAGVWAADADRRGLLEMGDLEEGLRAASAIGDDRLQQQQQGRVTPETFTHGTSEQRMRWFRRGLEQGTTAACDTFAAARL